MNYVNPNQPSSQIEEVSDGFQIKLKCDLDYHLKKCFSPIVDEYNLTLKFENGLIVIS